MRFSRTSRGSPWPDLFVFGIKKKEAEICQVNSEATSGDNGCQRQVPWLFTPVPVSKPLESNSQVFPER